MNSITLRSKLLKNLGANAYGQLITVVIQLVSVPLFLHYWGMELYGEWIILSAIPSYLSMSDIGFASVAANDMTIRVAKKDHKGALEVYQSIWIFISIISLVTGTILILLTYSCPINSYFTIDYISTIETQQLLFVLITTVLIGLQNNVLNAAFRSIGLYAYGTTIGNTIRLSEWLISIAMVIMGEGVVIVALSSLFMRLLGWIITWALIRKKASWLTIGFEFGSKQKIKDLTKPALAFMAFPLGLALSLHSIVIVIGIILGSSAVVVFSSYRTLSRLLVQMITMINHSIWPEISAAYGAEKILLIKQIHRRGSSITFWIALLSILILSFIGEWIIKVWTHNSFEQNHILLLLLLSTTFLNVLWQTSWVVLMATNQHNKISIVFILSAAIGLILSSLAMPYLGINGVGISLTISEIPLLFITINSTLKLVNDHWFGYIKSVLSNPL